MKKAWIGLALLGLMSSSCMDESWQESEALNLETEGVFIVNSGNFQSSTSSLSYYDKSSQTVYNNVISRANGLTNWGDVAQSMVIRNGIGYVVINNSGKVLMIDADDAQYLGSIEQLQSPRYMHFISDEKAYISDLYGRAINIVNPEGAILSGESNDTTSLNMQVNIGQISVNNGGSYFQHSTEKMLQWGDWVFVACWMRDNKVLVIDSNSDQVIDSITVAAQPNSLQIDKYNKLWVLCDGGYDGNPYAYEKPKLFRINLQSLTIEDSLSFDLDDNPQELCINASQDTLYFLNTDLYRMPVEELTPTKHILSSSEYSGYGRGFYALALDPANNDIYIADAMDNSQPGYVYRFSAQALAIDTFSVGVNPVSFCFK